MEGAQAFAQGFQPHATAVGIVNDGGRKMKLSAIMVLAATTAVAMSGYSSGTDEVVHLSESLIQTSGEPSVSAGLFYGYRSYNNGPGDMAFSNALQKAVSSGVPLVLVWSTEGCEYCNSFAKDLNANIAASKEWMSTEKAVFAFFKDNVDSRGLQRRHEPYACYDAANFAMKVCDAKGTWPYVAFYYKRRNGEEVTYASTKSGETKTLASVKALYAKWLADNGIDLTAGAEFVVSGDPMDRLEAVPGKTAYVDVPLTRKSVDEEEQYVLKVGGGDEIPVVFNAGESEPQTAPRVSIPAGAKAGDVISLVLADADGETVAESAIFVVDEPKNLPSNPLWIDDPTPLAFGLWTMDIDGAKAFAASNGGSTLVLVGGSTWCPDCVNTDENLVDTDVFKEWAAGSNVVCAAIDIPRFHAGVTVPCLVSLGSHKVSWAGGLSSGAGYLSRNMVSAEDAAAILNRNLDLTTNSVVNGGYCRPECIDNSNPETSKFKTGVPCFIMLNAAGEPKGRLYQFNNVSPTDNSAAAAYVRRLEELRQLADDPTEELNRHWSTATTADCEAGMADKTVVESTISAIDSTDWWRLVGDGRPWRQYVFSLKSKKPTGEASGEKNVRLALWRKVSSAKVEKIAEATGSIETGVEVSSAIGAAEECFLQVETIVDGGTIFALEHEGDSVVEYEISVAAEDVPGEIAFNPVLGTAKESEAKTAGGTKTYYATVVRTGGATGELDADITVDAASAAETDRYEVLTDSVHWDDGDMSSKAVAVNVFDDANADGNQDLVLRLGKTDSTYTLSIVDNDKPNPGKASFAQFVPSIAKAKTVIAEEGSTMQVGIERIGGASGAASATVSVNAGTLPDGDTVAWLSRETDVKWLRLELPALEECKSGKVSLSFSKLSGVSADSATKTVTVMLYASDAPKFEQESVSLNATRYIPVSVEVPVINIVGTKQKLTKTQGSIPAGLTAAVTDGKFVISGSPTGKGGVYNAVYQLSETRGRQNVAGATIEVAFTVVDPATLPASDPGANPSVAKSRTFSDSIVADAGSKQMLGLLTTTIPATGKASAKFRGVAGTVSMSASSWEAYDPATGALSTTLRDTAGKYSLAIRALRDGVVEQILTETASGDDFEIVQGGVWSAVDSADGWVGNYTVAFCGATVESGQPGIAPLGDGIATLKMPKTNAKTGKVTYAGTLANGQAFSGTAVLVRDGLDGAVLPILYSTAKDVFSATPRITSGQPLKAVEDGLDLRPFWVHTESVTDDGCYSISYLNTKGSYIDAKLDLTSVVSGDKHVFETGDYAINDVTVDVKPSAIAVDAAEAKEPSLKLSYAKATGIVSGNFRFPDGNGKYVSATYKGVVLPGWGDGCPSCGDTPFATGAYQYQVKIPYMKNGRQVTLSMKTGDAVWIAPPAE